jgi:hypothetical protein
MKPRIVNCTPHSITFLDKDGTEFTIKPSGYMLPARIEERKLYDREGIDYVETLYLPTKEGKEQLKILIESFPRHIYVGSVISAQAYRSDVVAPFPAPGYERMENQYRKMRTDKFLTFRKI